MYIMAIEIITYDIDNNYVCYTYNTYKYIDVETGTVLFEFKDLDATNIFPRTKN